MRFAPALAALLLAGCFGGKTPSTLLTLTPAPGTAAATRSATAGQAVTIEVPIASREIGQVRVPVLEAPGQVTYVKDLQYVETPDKLFQQLLSETVRRTTNRVVLEPRQTGVDPGTTVSGVLESFGYDMATGRVVVTYDATVATGAGTRVETRRFTASAPADGTAATVGPAINQAANAVARQAAAWIGG